MHEDMPLIQITLYSKISSQIYFKSIVSSVMRISVPIILFITIIICNVVAAYSLSIEIHSCIGPLWWRFLENVIEFFLYCFLGIFINILLHSLECVVLIWKQLVYFSYVGNNFRKYLVVMRFKLFLKISIKNQYLDGILEEKNHINDRLKWLSTKLKCNISHSPPCECVNV